jgi:hypothetical protein
MTSYGFTPEDGPRTAAIGRIRFWNWKMMIAEIAIAASGALLFNYRAPQPSGLFGLVAAAFALWLFFQESMGVVVTREAVFIPVRRFASLPILAFGRLLVKPLGIREFTIRKRWLGFDVVEVDGGFGKQTMLFSTRGQRRRFIESIARINPAVVTYRTRDS